MNRDEAIAELKQCRGCRRWVTTPTCDHCWVDQHRCPPTLDRALADLRHAVELGAEARRLAERLARMAEDVR